MCGIAGTYGFGDQHVLNGMTEQIAHRGPDGSYAYQDGAVLLGNRRLAIVDIGGGAQPMANEDGSVVVVTFACDLGDLASRAPRIERWDDVPAVSEDFKRARDVIVTRVTTLLEDPAITG